jgi:hypothetical protein
MKEISRKLKSDRPLFERKLLKEWKGLAEEAADLELSMEDFKIVQELMTSSKKFRYPIK